MSVFDPGNPEIAKWGSLTTHGKTYPGWGPWFRNMSRSSAGKALLLASGYDPGQVESGNPEPYKTPPETISAQPQESKWMQEKGRGDRRRQLASLNALRAAGNLPSRT